VVAVTGLLETSSRFRGVLASSPAGVPDAVVRQLDEIHRLIRRASFDLHQATAPV
jgi:hypothetical protein